jgi:dipeptidyl aminopeptidase/acylaminoacyl peptidase
MPVASALLLAASMTVLPSVTAASASLTPASGERALVAEVGTGARGGRIAYVAESTDRCSSCYDIFTMRPDGSGLRQLTHNGAVSDPDWSPNGRRILYTQSPFRNNRSRHDIWLMNGNGRHKTRMVRRGLSPAWAPGGNRFAFHRYVKGRPQVHVYTFRTGRVRALTQPTEWASAFDAAWSPEGKRIALAGTSATHPDDFADLYTMRVDGTGLRRLTATAWRSEGDPSWSPRGGRIAFDRWDPDFICTSVGVIRRSGDDEGRLRGCGSPSWSPNARWIVVTGLELLKADGTGRRPLPVRGGSPDWGVSPSR